MKYKLTIGWLYPDLMNIYGDRGNIIVLQKRCEWRGINTEIVNISLDTKYEILMACDLLMMGGAQDIQQTIVAKDLEKKKNILSELIENGTPGLYICGGFQFLGKYYKEADGTIIKQLGLLDVYTENPGGERLIGNIAVEVNSSPRLNRGSRFTIHSKSAMNHEPITNNFIIVGFENHGGRTRLGSKIEPLGKVIKGYGSNSEDGTEGAMYKNTIGTYLHGPILPKNPELADWLIIKALEKKYKEKVELAQLDDSLAHKAREALLKRIL